MKIMKMILFCLVFVMSAAVLTTSAQSEKREMKISDDIRAVMKAQAVAWNEGDIDGFMKGYWNSPELKFVSGDNITKGWQPTLDRYKKSYDSKAKMGVLTFSDLDINVLSKKSAVVLGSWNLDREVDGEKDNPHGKFTLIFQKFKDGWKIVHDHTS